MLKRPWARFGMPLIPVVAAWLLFVPTLGLPFFLDDLVAGPALHDDAGRFDWSRAAGRIWPTSREQAYHDHFRPVGWASIAIDGCLLGFHPAGLRAVAITLHGLIGAAVAGVVFRGRQDRSRAAAVLAGLAFVAHGASNEAVVWVAHRFTILSVLFFALALLAVQRFVGRGRLVDLGGLLLFGALALLAKDSMLTELFALVPASWALAPRGKRAARAVVVLLAVVALVAALLAVRQATLGTLLPSFDGGSDVAHAFDPAAILASLPRTLFEFIAPRADAGIAARTAAVSLLAALGLLLGFSIKDGTSRSDAFRVGAAVLGAAILLGLPTFAVGDDLDGSRRFYLPALGLALLLGGSVRGTRFGMGIAFVVLGAWSLRVNQAPWAEAGRILDRAQRSVEAAAARPGPVLVTARPGFPASYGGVPLFGVAATHFPLYFRPPFRRTGLEVRALAPEALVAAVDGMTGEAGLVVFDGPQAEPSVVARMLPAFSGEAAGLSIRVPGEGMLFPRGDAPPGQATIVEFEGPVGVGASPIRCTLEVEALRGTFFFVPKDQPGASIEVAGDRETVRWPMDRVEAAFPVAVAPALLARAGAAPAAARIEIQALGSAPGGALPSGRVTFRFGREP